MRRWTTRWPTRKRLARPMNMHPAFYYFLPAAALLLVYVPLTRMRLRAGVRPTRWTYVVWFMVAAMFVYSMVMGVLALQQGA